jgi:hypothetical protein
LERYCGVVWEHFDVDSMSSRARRLADSNVQIVSALGGLFRGGEPIPDYRLKMGSRLPTLGKLSAWWRPRLAPIAAERFARHTVVDLLPNEHSAALDPAGIALHTVRVRFRSPSGAAAAGHAAKAAKGLLARSLFERHHDDPVAVCSEFEGAGFVFRDLERTPSVTTVFVAATRRCQR